MNKDEVVIFACGAVCGFYVGHLVGDIRRQRRIHEARKRRYNDNRSDDVLKTIQTWFDDTSDTRPLNSVIEEWYYNNRFNKIVKGK